MLIKSMLSAFLMYSRIPVPAVEWKDENRRFALCFFPLVGAALGAAELLWFWLGRLLGVGGFLFGAVAAALPLLVTGGIHMDGFCDVSDALASWESKEKLLDIMADPHVGSFAVMRAALYLLLEAAAFSEVKSLSLMLVCALVFVQSRALSGLGAVVLKSAKAEGSLQSFRRAADKKVVAAVELLTVALTLTASALADPLCGLCAFGGEALCLVRFRSMAYKKFGGITGDLAGYFLQNCEITAIFCAVLANLIRSAVI